MRLETWLGRSGELLPVSGAAWGAGLAAAAAVAGSAALVLGPCCARLPAFARRKILHAAVFSAAAWLAGFGPSGSLGVFGAAGTAGLAAMFVRMRRGAADPGEEAAGVLRGSAGSRAAVGDMLTVWLCAGLGGTAAWLLAGRVSAHAFLAVAWGDALGELAGRSWGGVPRRAAAWCSPRTHAGSAGVFVGSAAAAWVLAAAGLPATVPTSWVGSAVPGGIWPGIVVAAAATAVERFSPPHLDNLLLLLAVGVLVANG